MAARRNPTPKEPAKLGDAGDEPGLGDADIEMVDFADRLLGTDNVEHGPIQIHLTEGRGCFFVGEAGMHPDREPEL